MGIRFRFKTAGTQRAYTVLKIFLKLVFIEMIKFKTQASKISQTYWIKYSTNWVEQMTIIQVKDKFPKI